MPVVVGVLGKVGRGIITTYTYDGANRLTDRSYSDGTADQFVLDDAGRITSATASRSGVVVARDYYPTGLIKSETTTWPFGISGTPTSAKVDYAYDAANRATTLTLPDGRTLDRTFTARNELESLTIGGQAITTLGYDNAGRRTSALFGNGLTDAREYTDNNLLKTTVVGPAAAPLLSLEYAYDANNRKTAETDHRDGSRSISIGYDDADRLTSWTTGGSPKLPASQTWDLSAVGDWTKTTVDGVVENREHTPVHEIKTRNGVGVGYDSAGNLIRTDSGQTFAWDAENRLLAADTAPNADGAKDRAVYLTDAFGRRVARSVYGSTYLAIHDGWQVVQEVSGPTTLPASAAADDGSLENLATVPAGAILPTTYDAQGNPQYPTRINFQPATTPIPSGYLADKSKDFAVRSNGLSYGWVAAESAPSRSEPVIRRFMPLPQYDTFVPTGDPETWTWQIALPPGSYPVVLVLGDATNREHTFNVTVQGETFADPHPYDPAENTGYEAGRFVGVAKQATVGADGLLTIQAAASALNGTLCWLEVGAEGTQLTDALRQKLADEVTHANARTGGSPFWDGGRSETKTFVWGPGIDELMGYQRTTAEAGTTTLYVHGNQQWSVMAVTDSSGQVVERFQYTATGKRASDVAGANERSISGLSTGWTGRAHDEATGTIYFRNREWDPDYQFISRDPAGYVDGQSLYRGYFVPNAVDPNGKWQFSGLGWGKVTPDDTDTWQRLYDQLKDKYNGNRQQLDDDLALRTREGDTVRGFNALLKRIVKYNPGLFTADVNCKQDFYLFKPGSTTEDDALAWRFSQSNSRDVGFNGGMGYTTEQEAALAVLRNILPTSLRDQWEYGGMIGKRIDGRYVASTPITNRQFFNVRATALENLPTQTIPAASYHTHTNPLSLIESPTDTLISIEHMISIYMANSLGVVTVYNPSARQETQIGMVPTK